MSIDSEGEAEKDEHDEVDDEEEDADEDEDVEKHVGEDFNRFAGCSPSCSSCTASRWSDKDASPIATDEVRLFVSSRISDAC